MKAFKIFLTTFFNLVLFSLANGVGILDLYYGPMRSCKSESVIIKAQAVQQDGKKVLAVKPLKATRDGAKIVSHTNPPKEMDAVFLDDTQDGFEQAAIKLLDTIQREDIAVVVFDEFQFFPLKVIDFVFSLLAIDINVVVAALNLNFLGQQFETTFNLMERALQELGDNFQGYSLVAICQNCRREGRDGVFAQYSQRIVDGVPVTEGGVIGINDEYEPRCERCFVRAS